MWSGKISPNIATNLKKETQNLYNFISQNKITMIFLGEDSIHPILVTELSYFQPRASCKIKSPKTNHTAPHVHYNWSFPWMEREQPILYSTYTWKIIHSFDVRMNCSTIRCRHWCFLKTTGSAEAHLRKENEGRFELHIYKNDSAALLLHFLASFS